MCDFFSFVSDPNKPLSERFLYFDWDIRQQILSGSLDYYHDSHTSISHYYGYTGSEEDTLNKYEFNPLTGKFQVDQINHKIDDRQEAEKWVRRLDFNKVCPLLIIKPLINPLKIPPCKVSTKDIANLKKWNSVGNPIWDSVYNSVYNSVGNPVGNSVGNSVGNPIWDSVMNSVGNSVGNSVRNSVGNPIWDSIWDSVRNSVWDSVGNPVGNSVWNSVGNSVRAYISSFFKIDIENDFSPLLALYKRGFVPSFDGTTWRLHSGKNANIVYEWKPERT
jgi:hypothetical protein